MLLTIVWSLSNHFFQWYLVIGSVGGLRDRECSFIPFYVSITPKTSPCSIASLIIWLWKVYRASVIHYFNIVIKSGKKKKRKKKSGRKSKIQFIVFFSICTLMSSLVLQLPRRCGENTWNTKILTLIPAGWRSLPLNREGVCPDFHLHVF